jgi:hypothetical protein
MVKPSADTAALRVPSARAADLPARRSVLTEAGR